MARMNRGLNGQDAVNDMLVTTTYNEPECIVRGGVSSTLNARDYKAATDLVVETPRKYVIRRLTPLECCRLQGFPDYWESGIEGSDSARYKMWGNGMALPCVAYVMQGIKDVLET